MSDLITIGRVQTIHQGTWNNTAQYEKMDAVEFEGSSYFCVNDNIGKSTDNNTYWQLMAKRGEKGDSIAGKDSVVPGPAGKDSVVPGPAGESIKGDDGVGNTITELKIVNGELLATLAYGLGVIDTHINDNGDLIATMQD
jgi:hypothetical protein